MSETSTRHPEITIALQYDGENAPKVTAKGSNDLAQRMIELADEYDVPLHEDPELAALLSQVPLGEEIPEALYHAVAEVIAFAYLLSGKLPPGYQAGNDPSTPTT